MEFEMWFEENGYDEKHKEFARTCWNACAYSAIDLIEKNYDYMEPWLTPDEARDALVA